MKRGRKDAKDALKLYKSKASELKIERKEAAVHIYISKSIAKYQSKQKKSRQKEKSYIIQLDR